MTSGNAYLKAVIAAGGMNTQGVYAEEIQTQSETATVVGQDSLVIATETGSVSASESTLVSESVSVSESISVSESVSASESALASESVSASESISTSEAALGTEASAPVVEAAVADTASSVDTSKLQALVDDSVNFVNTDAFKSAKPVYQEVYSAAIVQYQSFLSAGVYTQSDIDYGYAQLSALVDRIKNPSIDMLSFAVVEPGTVPTVSAGEIVSKAAVYNNVNNFGLYEGTKRDVDSNIQVEKTLLDPATLRTKWKVTLFPYKGIYYYDGINGQASARAGIALSKNVSIVSNIKLITTGGAGSKEYNVENLNGGFGNLLDVVTPEFAGASQQYGVHRMAVATGATDVNNYFFVDSDNNNTGTTPRASRLGPSNVEKAKETGNTADWFSSNIDSRSSVDNDTGGVYNRNQFDKSVSFVTSSWGKSGYVLEFETELTDYSAASTFDSAKDNFTGLLAATGSWQSGGKYMYNGRMVGYEQVASQKTVNVRVVERFDLSGSSDEIRMDVSNLETKVLQYNSKITTLVSDMRANYTGASPSTSVVSFEDRLVALREEYLGIKAAQTEVLSKIEDSLKLSPSNANEFEVLKTIVQGQAGVIDYLDTPTNSYIVKYSTAMKALGAYLSDDLYNDTIRTNPQENLANEVFNDYQNQVRQSAMPLVTSANALATKDVSGKYSLASDYRKQAYDLAKAEVQKLTNNGNTFSAPGTYVEISEAYAKLNDAIYYLDKQIADEFTLNTPVLTPVANLQQLTESEKQAVEQAVRTANDSIKDKIKTVSVSDNGTVTVTYTDNSIDTLQPESTVKLDKIANFITPNNPEVTPVKNIQSLTIEEKQAVEQAVRAANDSIKDKIKTISVSDNGTVTITYIDDSIDTIESMYTVDEAKDTTSESVSTSESMSESTTIAITVTPVVPSTKTPVADVTNLTDAEKAAVKKAVTDANADLADKIATITVGNDGTVTITYTDGSVDTISGSDLVEAKSVVSAKTPVSKQSVLLNTGENNSNIASVAGIALGLSGLVALVKSKRRSEEDK